MLLMEEHPMVRETTRKFAGNELGPVAEEIDEEERFPMEAYKKAGENELIGFTIPVEYGGDGAGLLINALINEEFCRMTAGFGMSVNMCTTNFSFLISQFGTEEQRARHIPAVIQGDAVGSSVLQSPRRDPMPFPRAPFRSPIKKINSIGFRISESITG